MFALIWTERALDQLADVYVAVAQDERDRIAAAVDSFNQRLQSDPLSEGESRSNGFRIAFLPLIAVMFRVSEADGVAHVTRVRRFGRS